MIMRKRILATTVLVALLAACAQQPPITEKEVGKQASRAVKPAASGAWHSEPVIYNGRRYAVAFRRAGPHERLVRISAPGRKLGATKGDGRVVAQIATSAVHHFSCRDSQKARVKPGSLRPQGGTWKLVVICR